MHVVNLSKPVNYCHVSKIAIDVTHLFGLFDWLGLEIDLLRTQCLDKISHKKCAKDKKQSAGGQPVVKLLSFDPCQDLLSLAGIIVTEILARFSTFISILEQ